MKSIIVSIMFLLVSFNVSGETITADQFWPDYRGNIESVEVILSSELIFEDFQTQTDLYKVRFEGVFYLEGVGKVYGEACYYMIYDSYEQELSDTRFLCRVNAEDVIEDIYPVYLYEE